MPSNRCHNSDRNPEGSCKFGKTQNAILKQMKKKCMLLPGIIVPTIPIQKISWNSLGTTTVAALSLLVGCSAPPATVTSPPATVASPSTTVASPPAAVASPTAAVASPPTATSQVLSYKQFVDELVDKMTAEVLSKNTAPCRTLIEQNPVYAKRFRSAIIEQLKDSSTPNGVRAFGIDAKAKIDEVY